jgi:hypothetical protein
MIVFLKSMRTSIQPHQAMIYQRCLPPQSSINVKDLLVPYLMEVLLKSWGGQLLSRVTLKSCDYSNSQERGKTC